MDGIREIPRRPERPWALLSPHGQMLFYVAVHPDATIPVIADALGFSERRVRGVLRELRDEGMVRVTRIGRRNRYEVDAEVRFRHPALAHVRLGDMLRAFVHPIQSSASEDAPATAAQGVTRGGR